MKADLETRIADAFSADLSSADLGDLLKEVGLADIDAKSASRIASEWALDPMTRPAEVAAARQEMADADFRSKRLAIAAERLTELHAKAKKREDDAEREKQRRAALAERDAVARDLVEYEALAGKIVVLLERLEASNARVPFDQTAEITARDTGMSWAVNLNAEGIPQINVHLDIVVCTFVPKDAKQ